MFREIIYFTGFLAESWSVPKAFKMTQLALEVHNSTKLAKTGLTKLKEMKAKGDDSTFDYSVGTTIVSNHIAKAEHMESELESMSH